MSDAPSGEQIEIASGDQRVVVVEVGGGLRAYTVAGADVLDGYAADAMSDAGRGQLLAPWPNRLEDGSYEFDGRRHQLPLTEVPNRNAIHGLVRWSAWTVAELAPDRVVMAHRLRPQPGYPFTLDLRAEYALSATGLAVRLSAANAGDAPCPFGCGMHPYLTLGVAPVDGLELRVPADTVLQANERSLPTGSAPVAGTDFDFRAPRAIGALRLDHCFTGLERDAAGRATEVLRDTSAGTTRTLWADQAFPYLMVFSGDTLGDAARRSVAVEPMTCPPNAFRSGADLVVLEPGTTWTGTWGITPG
jgi:aldose 1-epimerase